MATGENERRTCFVTGSGRGLGREYALYLAGVGYDVAVHDIDEKAPSRFGEAKSLGETVAAIEKLGRRAIAVTADISKAGEIEAAAAEVMRAFGRIDALVNNAGGDIGFETARPDPNDGLFVQAADVDWVIGSNLNGTIHACRAVAPYMMEQRCGRIVNVSSSAAMHAVTEGVVYAVAKAGIVHYTSCLAKQLKAYDVTVNAIAPGPTVGARFLATRTVKPELLEKTGGLDRLGRPLDQARVIEFLLSPEAGYVSGQTITVAGG